MEITIPIWIALVCTLWYKKGKPIGAYIEEMFGLSKKLLIFYILYIIIT